MFAHVITRFHRSNRVIEIRILIKEMFRFSIVGNNMQFYMPRSNSNIINHKEMSRKCISADTII